MKVIIAGPRDFTDMQAMVQAICDSGYEVTEVVSGGASGVDAMAEQWAHRIGIPVKQFPADWNTHGKAAGPIRNQQMAEYADALIALYMPPGTPGTRSMIDAAIAKNLPMFVYNLALNEPVPERPRKPQPAGKRREVCA